MEWLRQHVLRDCRKFTDMIPIAMALTFGLLLLGSLVWLLATSFIPALPSYAEDDPPSYEKILGMYMNFACIWPTVALAIAIPPANRRIFRDIMPNGRGNSLKGILLGLLLGFGLNTACIVISSLLGHVSLGLTDVDPLRMLALFGAVFLQSGAEEITSRQFLFEKLRRRYQSPWVAIIFNSLFFMAMHLFNPGISAFAVTQIFLIGFIFSLFVHYFDGLWIAIFFHTAWNYTQNIIFGCPNSGQPGMYSLFTLTDSHAGPFFDPIFGVEGSVGACALLAVLAVGILVFVKVKGIQGKDLWADLDAPRLEEAPKPQLASKPKHFA